MINAILFDLDGTILDTLLDLHNAVNHSITKYGYKEVTINEELDEYNKIQEVLVYDKNDSTKTIKVIGNDQTIDSKRLTISDAVNSPLPFRRL